MGTVEENFYNRVYSTGEYGGRGLDGLAEEAKSTLILRGQLRGCPMFRWILPTHKKQSMF